MQATASNPNDKTGSELALPAKWSTLRAMTEIIFEVREDDVAGGYIASALGAGIHTEADTLEELRANVKEAVDCYFDESMAAPKIIRLHFVRDEVLAR
jgi:predicted RNase H-like HicB family nuclease